jgi:uncharacterized membrane protein
MADPPHTDPDDRDPEEVELQRGSDAPALSPVLIIALLAMLGAAVYVFSFVL